MLKFHHIGCLVDDIDSSIHIYKNLFQSNNVSEKIFVSSQGVFVCFVGMTDHGYIELIEPVDETSTVNKFIKKGFTYYHVAYLVKNVDDTIAKMCDMHFKHVNIFYSEAFDDKKCAFLFSPDLHLIELIEE